jgi:hypothetical protein
VDTQRWQRVSAIFDEAVDVAQNMRAALLDRLCGDDVILRGDVEMLLAADVAATDFDRGVDFARGAVAADWAENEDIESVRAGDRVGPWRLIEELGRGGMGVVWLAERADGQFEQRAALKLIKRGMDSEGVLARFLRERQILARLEHPHIARLLDGGIAADGRPYFAMEYVAGEPLLRYCAERGLKLEERISLFLDICAAVQFAHRQLVVHRDLKPSNVLIGADGSAKLLDFGIAKLLGDEVGSATQTSEVKDRPLTPAYASPEQLTGAPISTATDVYALGAILYELLTGQRPHDLGDAPTSDEIRRLLETTAPPAPSKRATVDAPVAARRLRGDLDTIVLTALKREPERRYATVDALAADLRGYLDGRPIAARPDSGIYRTRKFVARHRIGAAAGVLAVVALLVATAVSWHQLQLARREAVRADNEARTAQAAKDFLLSTFAGADPYATNGKNVSVRELLESSAEKIDTALAGQDAVRADLHMAVADTFETLDQWPLSKRHFESAAAAYRSYLPADAPQVISAEIGVAQVRWLMADAEVLPAAMQDILQRTDGHGADYAQMRQDAFALLLLVKRTLGDYAGAAETGRQAIDEARRDLGAESEGYTKALYNLALVRMSQEHLAEADALADEFSAIDSRVLEAASPGMATDAEFIALVLLEYGRVDEARALLARVAALRRRQFDAQHAYILRLIVQDANALFVQSDLSGAQSQFELAITASHSPQNEGHVDTGAAEYGLGRVLIAQQRWDEAAQHIAVARARAVHAGGVEHPTALACREAQEEIAMASGDGNAGAELEAIAAKQRPGTARELPRTLLALARSERRDNSPVKAEVSLRDALDVLALQGRSRHPLAYEAQLQIAEVADAAGDLAKVRAARVEALATAIRVFGPEHARTLQLFAALDAKTDAARQHLVAEALELAGPVSGGGIYKAALQILDRAEAVSGDAPSH